MGAINSEKFERICDGVWRDRASILSIGGALSGEAALVRAVYWRLCKAGAEPDQSMSDHAPILDEMVRRYGNEAAPGRPEHWR